MKAAGGGDIVVTSSISGFIDVHWEPIYSCTKHAVQTFVHTVRRQLAGDGIRVMSLAPGAVANPLWGFHDPARDQARLRRRARVPQVRRLCGGAALHVDDAAACDDSRLGDLAAESGEYLIWRGIRGLGALDSFFLEVQAAYSQGRNPELRVPLLRKPTLPGLAWRQSKSMAMEPRTYFVERKSAMMERSHRLPHALKSHLPVFCDFSRNQHKPYEASPPAAAIKFVMMTSMERGPLPACVVKRPADAIAIVGSYTKTI